MALLCDIVLSLGTTQISLTPWVGLFCRVFGVDEYSRGGSTTGDFEPVGRRRNATTPRRGSCSGGNAAGIIPLINHTQHPAVYASPNGWGFFVGSSGWVSTAVAVRQQATLKPVGRRRNATTPL